MPTVREYFFADNRTLTSHGDYDIHLDDGGKANITARCHYDFDAGVRYASYLVPGSETTGSAMLTILREPGLALRVADQTVAVSMGHATLRVPQRNGAELPFSNRIYFYVEQRLSDQDIERLLQEAGKRGVMLDVRDEVYAEDLTQIEVPRAFLSHDSRDKVDVARPLANKLRDMLCPVWYDEFSLDVGDSLRASIDEGLRECPRCVLILSPNFLANDGWAAGEFNAVIGKHFGEGGGVLLPVWHNLTRDEVAAYSPLVVDIIALNSDLGTDELAARLYRRLMA